VSIDFASAPPRGWWARSLAWLLAGWAAALVAAGAASVATSLAAGGTFWRALGGFALVHAPYLGGWFGLVALPVLPVLVAWGALGPALGRVERTWAGVALGTALVAGFAMHVGVGVFGGPGVAPPARFAAWLVAWAGLLLPRVVCPALRPGAFGGVPRSAA
jgi:hypothetical protein